jgi:hypothetical protein
MTQWIRTALVLAGFAAALAAVGVPTAGAEPGGPLCESHIGTCLDTRSHKNYEGDYVGHDEPSVLFYSNRAGSGNSNVWQLQIPRDPPVLPTQRSIASGTWNFQLHPAFWFGMAMCDTQSYPNVSSTCTADSDTNIKNSSDPNSPDYIGKHAGTAFMELQFYPPGYIQQFTGFSCAARQWCAAMTIDGLSDDLTQANNADCLQRAGEEYADFAYLTLNGAPQGPPDPLNFEFVGSGLPGPSVLYMNPGDRVTVSIQDSLVGVVTTVVDHTTGQSGSMTASVANGFGHPKFQPNASSCSDELYAYHPMYSTSSENTRVPWAAHSYNVAFSDEIGHFEYCNGPVDSDGICHQRNMDLDDDFCFDGSTSLLVHVAGCMDSDIDFNGTSYQPDWPGTFPNPVLDQLLHPQSFVVTSPLSGGLNYERVAFETDLPAIEFLQGCDVTTGAGCTNPPARAAFYPFYSTTGTGGSCAWREGGRFMPGTTNAFGGSSTTEYGSLLPLFYATDPRNPVPGTAFEDYHNGLSSNPCPSNGSLP